MIAILLTALAISVPPGYQGDQAHPREPWPFTVYHCMALGCPGSPPAPMPVIYPPGCGPDPAHPQGGVALRPLSAVR